MRWPWRRREQPRHALPRQATWAQPAFPPGVEVAQAPELELATAPVVVPMQSPGVLLGFSDGTQVALDERDPSALALRAVADLLVQDRVD